MTHYFDVAVHQVRAASASPRAPNFRSGTRAPRVLETEDLSVLTGWAQAIAEAVAYAPECLDTLLADAGADAP